MNVDFSDDDDDSFLLAEEAVKALDDVEQQYMLSQAVDGHKSGEGWGRRSETSSLEGDGTVGSVSSSTAFTVQSLPVTQDPHQLSTSQVCQFNCVSSFLGWSIIYLSSSVTFTSSPSFPPSLPLFLDR